MMECLSIIFLLGMGFVVGFGTHALNSTDNNAIKGQKEFIVRNASYKCTKTNQLLKGDEK